MQKVYTSLTMFLRKTSSNPQKLMPFKVFQHNPKISTRSKAIRLGSKIATYLLLTLKNLRFPTFLLKIPNWNPVDTKHVVEAGVMTPASTTCLVSTGFQLGIFKRKVGNRRFLRVNNKYVAILDPNLIALDRVEIFGLCWKTLKGINFWGFEEVFRKNIVRLV